MLNRKRFHRLELPACSRLCHDTPVATVIESAQSVVGARPLLTIVKAALQRPIPAGVKQVLRV